LPSAPVTPVNVPPKAEKKATDQRIRGNRSSKIYHFPDCPGYNRISSKNVEMFSDAASAQAAGYSMAKNCKAR
ncbi:deoxyribonuclease I, partial [Klebsiella pneumoniae]|nr:deoxyribonuclease I [Klebsiella pneumoniae]